MKITNEAVHRIYDLCEQVANNQYSRSEALNIVAREGLMAEGSATIYLNIYKCLRSGAAHKRAMNEYSTQYFLSAIYKDHGLQALKKALQSSSGHVTYYNSLNKGRRTSITKVIDEISEKYQLSHVSNIIYPDEVDSSGFKEGKSKAVHVNVYERNPKARSLCLEHYGLNCVVCDFNFEAHYGQVGIGFIHVHHLVDIATVGAEYTVDPINDLRPVCPNCHAMLHSQTPAMKISVLKERLKIT